MARLALLALILASCGSATPPPNILLILVDDLGVNDIGISNNNPMARTPNIDHFANEGVRFTRHYTDTVCSPSRAALLTGLFPARLGYRPLPRGISPDVVTMADALRERGYSTYHIGKWHLGDTQLAEARPNHQGFDRYFGFLSQWLLSGTKANGKLVPSPGTYFNPWLMSSENPEGQRYQGHLSDILVARTISTIEASKDKRPWFINYWTYLPHFPIEPAPRFAARRQDNPQGHYYAMTDHLDSNIGKVLNALEKSGQSENTIVVITSDNGGTNMQVDNNAPFVGRKMQYREGALRTPLMIRWPGTFPAGKEVDQVVSLMDIFPTLAAAVGAEVPAGIDGRDIRPAVYDQPLPEQPLYWGVASKGFHFFSVLSADGRWRLDQSAPAYEEPAKLYDLQAEPSGASNVFDRNPEVAATLNRDYWQWHRKVRRIETHYKIDQKGNAQLTGNNFLRSPGWQAFTFAIAVELEEQARSLQLPIADQSGLWQLTYHADTGFTAQIGQYQLNSGQAIDQGCHSVVVSGQFKTYRSAKAAGGKLRLYVNGVEVDSTPLTTPPELSNNLSVPTYLGYPPSAEKRFPGNLGRPVIVSVDINKDPAFDAKTLDQEVCSR
ncbi:hypothetical protein BST96_05480 [Oceanicoccus sagamiensis]|uniref:Sulfatase N-terminal domain-containing protein n=2 Tax=Oceanicoccus sagamiensis TaxID=716816 RepID=A0A1X9N698_9GAMM|nr:hypothetical protein BST96_05480 [Oceanicoccus sagamiensis]